MSQVLKSGRSIDQFTMDSLREFLEVVLSNKARSEKNGRNQMSQSRRNSKRKGAQGKDANASKRNRKGGNKFCSYCKSNGKSRKVFTSHDVGDCSFLKDKKSGEKDKNTVQRAFALKKRTTVTRATDVARAGKLVRGQASRMP